MKIKIFYPKGIISIKRSFEPLVRALRKTDDVQEYELPYKGGNPINLLKNIIFVRKHRVKDGVNHIAGDAHYCILGLIGVPSVLTIHDDYAMRTAHRGLFDTIYKWIFWLKLPILFARKIVCISPSTHKNIYKYVKSSKMYVVSHHCMNEDFKYSEKEFNTECPIIFQVGTLPHKNAETTIKALEGLNCEYHVLRPMTDEQKRLADELHIRYVNFVNLTNEEVIEEYKKADIVVFPSDFEGFGMPVIEAQATGRVVITTNQEPMNWVAGQNGAIFIKNPKNSEELRGAILKTIENQSLREKCIKNGLGNVKRFSIDSVYKNYCDIYNEAILNIPSQLPPKWILAIIMFTPIWRFKRYMLNHWLHYDVVASAQIGYSWFFPKHLVMKKETKVGHGVYAYGLDKVVMEKKSTINRGCRITGFPTKTVSPHFMHDTSRRSELIIGENTDIVKDHHLDCTNMIKIGSFCTVAGYGSQFLTHSIDIHSSRQDSHPIIVGDYCFLSTKLIVLGGSGLPNYSVLAAGAVLNKKYTDEYMVYGGVPAKPIKALKEEDEYFRRTEGFVY